MNLRDLHRGHVWLDGLQDQNGNVLSIQAWLHETNWNGWAVPYFELDEAMRLATALDAREPGVLTFDGHRFVAKRGAVARGDEVIEPVYVEGRALYGIGGYSWCWNESLPAGSGTIAPSPLGRFIHPIQTAKQPHHMRPDMDPQKRCEAAMALLEELYIADLMPEEFHDAYRRICGS